MSSIRQHATTTRETTGLTPRWRAYDGRYHFIAQSSRGMALYCFLLDATGRDVEVGIDAEYSPDEAIIHFDRRVASP